MSIDLLNIAHCPSCGKVYQKNLRNLCASCQAEEDKLFQSADRALMRNRQFDNEGLSAAAGVPQEKIRIWIRAGKIRLQQYPNLTDQCDLCHAPIRAGHLCNACSMRIKTDLANTLEQERLMKERLRAANAYISKK